MRDKNISPTIERRLKVIQLASELGNVSEACRIHGMNRSSFYGWKRRYEQFGIEGLYDLPSTPKHNPRATPKEVADKIVAISLQNPSWGCIRIAEELKRQGIVISSPTIQKILIKNDIATIKSRWNRLEYLYLQEGYTLSQEQISRTEKLNPAFKERDYPLTQPGALLSTDIYYVGTQAPMGRLYLCVVVDAYSSYAFAAITTSDHPDEVASLLHTTVFPFFAAKDLPIRQVLSSSSAKFLSQNNSLKSYLRINEVEHIISRQKSPPTNGYAEKLKMISYEEFIKPAIKSAIYPNLEEMKTSFSTWLEEYNTSRSNKGFPNFGAVPLVRLEGGAAECQKKSS